MSVSDTQFVFQRVQQGDEDAAQEVFDRYVARLIGLARARISDNLTAKLDADDVVQSAFRSFFTRAQNGQFEIERAGDLWKLLASITRRKVLKKAEYFRQGKRDWKRDQPLGVSGSADITNSALIEEPSNEEVIALADEVEYLLRAEPLRSRLAVELRLQGRTIPEIASTIERSERTVRRALGNFRAALEQRLEHVREEC